MEKILEGENKFKNPYFIEFTLKINRNLKGGSFPIELNKFKFLFCYRIKN